MAISIKDPETDRLARALAAATGESLTDAIREARRQRLARESQRPRRGLGVEVRRLQERIARLPVLDARPDDEVLGYDDHGVPRLTMVIDTSALVAMLQGEPSAERLIAAVEADQVRLVSAATVVEASLVLLGRFGEAGDVQLDSFARSALRVRAFLKRTLSSAGGDGPTRAAGGHVRFYCRRWVRVSCWPSASRRRSFSGRD